MPAKLHIIHAHACMYAFVIICRPTPCLSLSLIFDKKKKFPIFATTHIISSFAVRYSTQSERTHRSPDMRGSAGTALGSGRMCQRSDGNDLVV